MIKAADLKPGDVIITLAMGVSRVKGVDTVLSPFREPETLGELMTTVILEGGNYLTYPSDTLLKTLEDIRYD